LQRYLHGFWLSTEKSEIITIYYYVQLWLSQELLVLSTLSVLEIVARTSADGQ